MSVVRPSKKVFLQVLWNGLDTSVPSLYLFTDTRRYMFNCGEGLQRMVTQRKIKLGKLDTFFLTRYQWSHMGGLPGFGVTLKDMGNDTPFSAKTKQNSEETKMDISKEIIASDSASDQKNIQLIKILEDHQKSTSKEQEKNAEENKKEKEKDLKGGTSIFRKTAISEEIITSDSVSDKKDSQLIKTVEDNQKSTLKEQGKNTEENKNEEKKDIKDLHKVTVYAPYGMKKIINSAKSFIRFEDNPNFKFEVNEHTSDESMHLNEYTDHELSVYSIPIYNSKKKIRPKYGNKNNNHIAINISPTLFPPSLCYACHLHPFPGKFNVKNAKKLGVPMGPLYGELQRGETVVLENGKKVTSEEVMGPEIPGPIFLVIDCPSIHYIESLTKNTHLEKYLSLDKRPHLVVHLSAENVCKDGKYSEWIKRFPHSTTHMYLNNLVQESVVYESQHCLQIMLNHINSEIFPLTKEHNIMAGITTGDNSTADDNSLKNFLKINLREFINNPSKAIDDTETKSEIEISELLNRVTTALNKRDQNNEKIVEKCNGIAGDIMNVNGKRCSDEELNTTSNKKINLDGDSKSISNSCPSKQIYPKAVCLGTGAASPSKYRNVSSTLVLFSENDAVLLDCGEGTYGQLFRHYGDNINEILCKIKFIFISHMHADHHLGLITLIRKLNALKRKPYITAPTVLRDWLCTYAGISESLNFEFISCKDAIDGIFVLQNMHVQPVKVEHPAIAHGVVLTYNNDIKITYSGDTLPCDALIAAGANSTLLIHEATLEDDMAEDALDRKHSTTSQAIDVAQKMNAKFVLLTHFSQRYPKIPIIKNKTLASRTAYAFDHMEVTLDDIPKFCHLVPALTALYTEEKEE